MGKICDPPPFNGGQSAGVYYRVTYKETNLRLGSVVQRTDTLLGAIGAPFDIFEVKLDPVTNQMRGYTYSGFTYNSGTQTFIWRQDFGTGQDPVLTRIKPYEFTVISVVRADGQTDTGGDLPTRNCKCSDDSCRVDCATAPDGFCCIDHAVTNRLLQTLQG